MGYTVDNGSLHTLLASYNNVVSGLLDEISAVVSAEGTIQASTNIAGNNADRMKEYLNTVYSCAQTSLSMLLELFSENFLLYLNDYQQIDDAMYAHIDEEELWSLHGSLENKRSRLRDIDEDTESTIKTILDIFSLPIPYFDDVDDRVSTILKSIEELDENIGELESKHSSADFTEIDALISNLESYFSELCGLSKEYKTAFTTESFAMLASVPALASSVSAAYDQITAQESDVAGANEDLKERIEKEQERQEKLAQEQAEREKQAELAKLGVSILVGAATTILVATTGPVGAVVVGGVGGAVSSAFNTAADQYVEYGWDTQNWDIGKIGSQAVIGGITGAFGQCFPGAGTCAKAGISALSSAFATGAGEMYDIYSATGTITSEDWLEIGEDTVISGISSGVGSLVGSYVSNAAGNLTISTLGDTELFNNNYLTEGGVKHFAEDLIVNEISGVTSGIAERGVKTAVTETGDIIVAVAHGESLQDAYSENNILAETWKSATDVKEIIKDAVGTAVDTIVEDPWEDWDSEEYDRMMEKLAEMDARGEDAENYEIFGDPRSIEAQRQAAVNEAWAQERKLVLQGKGTRDWSVSQQEELIRTGKVSGFEGQHMLSVSENADLASDPDNIQFLTYEEHLYGAHKGNFKNATSGRYDPETGKMETIDRTKFLQHQNTVANELSQKFDYTQSDLAKQLGSDFGYGRGKKSKDN